MTSTYAKAYTEVLEIIKYFSKEEYNKIPTEKINFYKNNKDKDYIYKINPQEELSKQNISREANAILITLFRDYFATEIQKKTLTSLLNQNQKKLEEIRREEYNPDKLFKKQQSNISKEQNNRIENKIEKAIEEKSLVKIEEKWYKKIILFFKNILKK
jgi:hypothetical protein